MIGVWDEWSISCGYDAMSGEMHAKHASALHMAMKGGMRMTGYVPGAIRLPTSGWDDVVFMYKANGRYVKTSKL